MWEKVKLLSSWIWEYLKPVATVLLQASGRVLVTVATNVVRELATSDLSSAEKRSLAVSKIQSTLAQQAIQASASEINLAIEMAVTGLKRGA